MRKNQRNDVNWANKGSWVTLETFKLKYKEKHNLGKEIQLVGELILGNRGRKHRAKRRKSRQCWENFKDSNGKFRKRKRKFFFKNKVPKTLRRTFSMSNSFWYNFNLNFKQRKRT